MAGGLRILMAEDNPTDTELIHYALRRAGLVYEAIRVETKEKFIEAIREFKPDIIISDYEMPEFKGSSALAIALVECPAVPFILVSGAISEALADEMLKAGATDYIPKQKLSRLAPAVRRAIAKSRERKFPGVTEVRIEPSLSGMEKTLGRTMKVVSSLIDIRRHYITSRWALELA
jgi:CheY-like chemotaxis protein